MEEPKERGCQDYKRLLTWAPTVRFDAMPKSLEVVDVIERERVLPDWYPYDVTTNFESRHPRYVDRSGEALL